MIPLATIMQVPQISGGPSVLFRAKEDGGIKADGVTDDADALQQIIWLAAIQAGAPAGVLLPAGTIALGHPVTVPSGVSLVGMDRTFSGWVGSTLIPLATFNKTWNPNSIAPALLQSDSYAPDPTGKYAWNKGAGGWWHNGQIWNVQLQNPNNVTGLDGIAIHQAGEQSLLFNVSVLGFQNNYKLTGMHATFTGILLGCSDASSAGVRMTRHSYYQSDSNGGSVQIFKISGDNNDQYFYLDGSQTLMVCALKMENSLGTDPNGSMLTVDMDPYVIGSGGGYNGGGRANVLIAGSRIYTASGDPSKSITTAIRIKKTGSSNSLEWPSPQITLLESPVFVTTMLQDDTWNNGAGRTVGSGQTAFGPFWDTSGGGSYFTYCRDGNSTLSFGASVMNFINGMVQLENPLGLPTFTKATVPGVGIRPAICVVSDTASGQGLCILYPGAGSWVRVDGQAY